uniref:NCK associated protein 5 n=1 Tax=Lepisosteus oculatus TaxID=7918 RepID=W5M4W2_LEPOC
MEETVRNLLQTQGSLEQTAVDTVDIMKAYKDKLSEEVKRHKQTTEDMRLAAEEDSQSEGSSAEEERDKTKQLLERLRALEAENSALALENENQREQYERCLDEVANQVVQALLTQKDLREECLKLRTRVFDLEQQNRTLNVLFQQRVQPASGLLLQESQQNVKPGISIMKCQSQLSLTVPTQLYPRSSCSSSELSLSSACSEYSSGSCTWNDGKSCSKMESSLTWEKRVSIGSSAPSNISCPAEEQPPTRKKESHILEGLKRLQKRKPMEPSSLKSKWGYKDCMNSNEGIYSPGIKCGGQGALKSQMPCKTTGLCTKREHGKKFTYESDSHDDADDESTNAPSLCQEIPIKDCRTYSKKLTHSVSDSLFSWEYSGKSVTGKPSYFNSKERPEKLTSFINGFLPGEKNCAILSPPVLQCEPSPTERDCALQLSDFDDLEVLEDLHVESGDEKTTAVHQLAEKQAEDTKRLSKEMDKEFTLQCQKYQSKSQQPDSRPKTFNLIKQHKVVKNALSEECITVVFDAEDGEPIELSSQQTGVISVTRNEISVGQQQTVSTAEYTKLIPQGKSNCQKGSNARNYTLLESPENQAEHQPDNMAERSVILSSACADTSSERVLSHIPQQQKLIKPIYSSVHKVNSSMQNASTQKANLTKIPSRGKGSPQKVSKVSAAEASNNSGTSTSSFQEKSPSSPPVKLSRYIKPHGGSCIQSPKAELGVSKYSCPPQQSSKIPNRNEWGKSSSTGNSGSPLLPRRHIEPVDYGEQPTRDRLCDARQTELRSPSPPPPPGRSASLLIRPNYENTPVALKPGAHLTGANALRGTPHLSQIHHQHQPPLPDMQHLNSPKGQYIMEPDASHCTEITPQKLVENANQHLQKSPGINQTPTKGSPKRATDLVTSQISKNLHPKVLRKCPVSITLRKASHCKAHSPVRKGKLLRMGFLYHIKPLAAGHSPNTPESQSTQSSQVSPTSSSVGIIPQSSEEKLSKTRIPIGLKALVKSPPLLRKSYTVPGKQEKDSINSASKGTMTASHFSECDTSEGIADFEMETAKSDQEIKSETHSNPLSVETLETSVVSENGSPVCAKGDGESRLFKRSVSVTNKAHLKPALGMNGAKARSQSFSTHSGEKPSASILEGPGKIRTQIITNTAERGNSLTRQNSLIDGFQLKPATGQSESPSHSPRGVDVSYNRQGSHGSMSSPSKIALRTTPKGDGSKNTSVGDGSKSPPQKEARSLPLADRFGLKNSRRPVKVASHPLFDTVSSPVFSTEQTPEANGSRLFSPNRSELVRPLKKQDPTKGPEITENPVSPSVSTIEEKVMMGIQENMQKGQVQDKPQASETKQKTGSTLASWFGFRKSKLPALSGKKTDASKAKDDKKDIKIGSVLGGKQMKSDKKKDKKKHEPQCKYSQEQTKKAENSDKLGSIMDHCNSQQGQPMKQIQRSATCVGKDQFMKELLNRVDKKAAQLTENGSNHVSYRTVSKGSSQGPALPSISINSQGNQKKNNEIKGDMEIQSGAVNGQKSKDLTTDNDEEPTMEPTCQDHMIGSSCQMRTLDSGIGTFPLPDSADRVTGRHLPKSESNPERVLSVSPEPTEHHALAALPKATTLEREVPSNCETCQDDPSSIGQSLSDPTVAPSRCVLQRHLSTPTISGKPNFEKQKKNPTTEHYVPNYRHEEKGFLVSGRDHCAGWHLEDMKSPGNETKQVEEKKQGPKMSDFSKISLESLNKINSNSGPFVEKERKTISKADGAKDEHCGTEEASSSCSDKPGVDNLESLSDSLYESFSSCASQGSNDV